MANVEKLAETFIKVCTKKWRTANVVVTVYVMYVSETFELLWSAIGVIITRNLAFSASIIHMLRSAF